MYEHDAAEYYIFSFCDNFPHAMCVLSRTFAHIIYTHNISRCDRDLSSQANDYKGLTNTCVGGFFMTEEFKFTC